jgi:hypothetical protein
LSFQQSLKDGLQKRNKGREGELLHPFSTILTKPWYGNYVRHVSEDGMIIQKCYILPIFRKLIYSSSIALTTASDYNSFQDRLTALRLCTHLQSFSWTDSGYYMQNNHIFVAYLDVLRHLPLTELKVSVSSGVSARVVDGLSQIRGLEVFGLWTSYCAIEDLSFWASRLGRSVRRLQLGVPSGAIRTTEGTCHWQFLLDATGSTLTMPVLSHMRHLEHLRLDAPHSNVPELLDALPNLVSLDVHYHSPNKCFDLSGDTRCALPLARLQHLTVHITHSVSGLWGWITDLIPHRGTLRSLTIHNRLPNTIVPAVPTTFITRMGKLHGSSLCELSLRNLELSTDNTFLVCATYLELTSLSFSLAAHALVDFHVHFY